MQNPSFDRLKSELAEAGLNVFDPAVALSERKRRLENDVDLKTDTHWSPAAMGEVAEQLAAHLRRSDLLPPAQRVNWQPRQETIRSSGDLTARLNLPKGQRPFPPETVRVAHWALLDGVTRTPATRKPGWSGRLSLQVFEANPQLKSLSVSDTLRDDFQAVLYYDSAI